MELKKIKKRVADSGLLKNTHRFIFMKHNGFVFILATLISILYSCNHTKKPWTVNANIAIADVPEAYLYKVNMDRTDSLIDSTSIVNHIFRFNGFNTSDELGVYRIKFSKGHGNGLTVFVNNGDEITVDIRGEYKNEYTGNELQTDYSKYLQAKQQEIDLMKELMAKMDSKASKEQLEASRKWYSEKTKMIDRDKATIISEIKNPELNGYLALEEILTSSVADKSKFETFANSLTDNGKETKYGKKVLEIIQYFDAYDLLFQSILMNYEELHKRFTNLDDPNKKSKFGVEISNKLSVLESLGYGKTAPPLIAKTINGKSFNLNQVKSKIVLIDFWASWCGPCREENKNYVNLYKQFNNKGFEIVGYSLDTDVDKWGKAVKSDGLLWVNVSNLKKQKEDDVLKSYQIDAIPSNIILKEGKIVARNIFGYELEDFLNSHLK